jgi:hypothetical protein
VVQNIYLGLWTDALLTAPGNFTVSQLTPALTFRKKVAEVTLSIAGLTLGLRALFGNFGTASAPDFRAGLVLILAGQTVSGITVRSETWVGARQGFECFGECKPASRLGFIISTFAPVPSLGGVVGPSIPFEPQEEKLFITGLTLAGIRNDIAMEFVLSGAGASSLQPTNMSITSTWRITPLRLTITNIARFGAGLTLLRDIMLFGINIGEVGTTVQLDFRPTPHRRVGDPLHSADHGVRPARRQGHDRRLVLRFRYRVPGLPLVRAATRSLRSTTTSRLRWAT